ncbi:MAG TPA: FecR domain-containing protein [Chryseolinea sp.]|nr:FecR domain-containing protein [Chryseolinea sp.]
MPNDLKILLQKYLAQTASEEETAQLMELLADPLHDAEAKELIAHGWSNYEVSHPLFSAEESHSMLQTILGKEPIPATTQKASSIRFLHSRWLRYAAAALIILAVAAIAYVTMYKEKRVSSLVYSKASQSNVVPGGPKATLTLADGRTIRLDDAGNGSVTRQGNTEIYKPENGHIIYQQTVSAEVPAMLNSIQTPAGGHYRITLADGTKVWLNSGSSITYPAVFSGNTRSVKISGEAYFEVAHNKLKPFIVDVDGRSTVQVLGTSFNINAYQNEPEIKTTLVEGRVWVDTSVILQPHQQAVKKSFAPNQLHRQSVAVQAHFDMEQALAWKNGLFNFNGMDLRAVMRQLERWYDIEIRYQASVDKGAFRGKIYRNANLSEVLDILQKVGGVKFRLEGKILTVI